MPGWERVDRGRRASAIGAVSTPRRPGRGWEANYLVSSDRSPGSGQPRVRVRVSVHSGVFLRVHRECITRSRGDRDIRGRWGDIVIRERTTRKTTKTTTSTNVTDSSALSTSRLTRPGVCGEKWHERVHGSAGGCERHRRGCWCTRSGCDRGGTRNAGDRMQSKMAGSRCNLPSVRNQGCCVDRDNHLIELVDIFYEILLNSFVLPYLLRFRFFWLRHTALEMNSSQKGGKMENTEI